MADVREKSQSRVGLSSFARPCSPDPLLEMPDEMTKERYCFPAKARLNGTACCAVQAKFTEALGRLQANPATRSLSAQIDGWLFLPLKVFFVLIVVAIGLLLAVWRDRIDTHYREFVPQLERGVIIGAFAMLFWPAMDYGYQQTANVLFGRVDAGPQIRLSLVIAPWALLLLFYFLRRLGKQGEMIGQISGVIVAAVAVLRYEQLNDWVGRLFGSGMDEKMMIAQAVLAVLGLIALFAFRNFGPKPRAAVLRLKRAGLTQAACAPRGAAGHRRALATDRQDVTLGRQDSEQPLDADDLRCCRRRSHQARRRAIRDAGDRLDRSAQSHQGRGPAGRAGARHRCSDARGDGRDRGFEPPVSGGRRARHDGDRPAPVRAKTTRR